MTVLSKVVKSFVSLPARPPLARLVPWCLAGFALSAQAQNVCDALPSGQTLEAALATLRSLEPQCHKQARFLYTLGRLLNQAGRYDEAIDSLEAALLYRPAHWPSQLEYAIALEGMGDRASVLGLLQALLQNPDVDPAARQQIAALASRPVPAPAKNHHGSFSLATGFDNNLLGNTYHTEFTLTAPTGLLPVQLADDQRPIAGAFIRADIGYSGLLTSSPSTQWRYSLAASFRTSPTLVDANVGQFSALVERNPVGAHGLYVFGQHQTLLRDDSIALRQAQFGLGYDFSVGPGNQCKQRLGLDFQHLSYPISPAFDGRYGGVTSITNCPGWGLQIVARTGEDQPADASRPGGAQRQYSLRVSKRSQLPMGSLLLEVEGTQQDDQSGYSPLLQNNAQRSVSRTAYRMEYRLQTGAISPYLGVEWLDQRSNLTLFELKNWVLSLGFRFGW